MKLTPHEILKYLGVHVPEEGIEINPHDAYLHATLLRLLGDQMRVGAIPEGGLTELLVGLHGAHTGPGAAVPEPTSETLEKLRTTLRSIKTRILGMGIE